NDPPVGADKNVIAPENGFYPFTLADFAITDPKDTPANQLASIRILSVPPVAKGTLTNNGNTVSVGSIVLRSDITGGNFKFTPALNQSGTGFTNFTFQVKDDGLTANGGNDQAISGNTISIDVSLVSQQPLGADST